MINMKIRLATSSDTNDIIVLDNQYEYERYSEGAIRSSLESSSYINYIAFHGDKAIGYVSFLSVVNEAELLKIVVDKDFRHMGIGYNLISTAINGLKAKGTEKVFLEVRADNLVAKRLYSSIGFCKINIRQKYYEDGGDAEIYSLSL